MTTRRSETGASFALACEVDWEPDALAIGTGARAGEPLLAERRVQTLVAVALHEAGASPGEEIELSVAFTGPERVAQLNLEHREVEGPTDVLSFPIDGLVEELPPGMPRQLGDVVVCPAYVERQVAEGTTMLPKGPGQEEGDATLAEALERCVVHGVLHLVGFDHERGEAAAEEMFALEQLVLDRVRGASGAPR